jgi:hypothetical protein
MDRKGKQLFQPVILSEALGGEKSAMLFYFGEGR